MENLVDVGLGLNFNVVLKDKISSAQWSSLVEQVAIILFCRKVINDIRTKQNYF